MSGYLKRYGWLDLSVVTLWVLLLACAPNRRVPFHSSDGEQLAHEPILALLLPPGQQKSRQNFTVGFAAAQAGDCKAAEKSLRAVKSDYLVRDILLAELASCFESLSQWRKADQYNKQALATMPRLSPSYPALLLQRAYLVAMQQKWKELRKIVGRLPPPSQLDDVKSIARYLSLFRVDADRGKRLLQPYRRDLYLSFLARQDDAAAKQVMGRQDPTEVWQDDALLKDLAQAYRTRKEYRKARDYYQQYFDRTKDYSILFTLARIHKLLANPADREKTLFTKVESARTVAEKQISMIQLGRFFWNNNRIQEARRMFDQAWRLSQESPEAISALYYHGRLLEIEGDWQGAEVLLEKAFPLRTQALPFKKRRLQALQRLGWIAYKQGFYRRAIGWYDAVINEDDEGSFRDASYFWLALSYQALHEQGNAFAALAKLVKEYPLSYYGLLARKRLSEKALLPEQPQFSLLTPQKPMVSMQQLRDSLQPAEWIFLRRYAELAAAELESLAAAELKPISWRRKPASALLFLATCLHEVGDVFTALRLAKFAISYDESNPPKKWLAFLYPRPYWQQVQYYAAQSQFDAYLSLALMRQESEFDQRSLSHADAYGLMQIIPPLAFKIAADFGLPAFAASELFNPGFNVRLGSYHLGKLLHRYQGNAVYALAAYNGSESALARWRKAYGRLPLARFIEEITYGETKNYVKRVVRNYAVYQLLYLGEMDLQSLP